MTAMDPLHLRKVSLHRLDGLGSAIVSRADFAGVDWIHASIAHSMEMPTYDDLTRLHYGVWRGAGFAYQVFAPDADHINIHAHALHLWGRDDGKPAIPDFPTIAGVRSI